MTQDGHLGGSWKILPVLSTCRLFNNKSARSPSIGINSPMKRSYEEKENNHRGDMCNGIAEGVYVDGFDQYIAQKTPGTQGDVHDG